MVKYTQSAWRTWKKIITCVKHILKPQSNHFLYGVNWLHFENLIPFSSVRLNHKIPNLHTGQTKSTKKSDAFLRPNLLWTLRPYCKRNKDLSNKNNAGSFKFPTFITRTRSKMCPRIFRLSGLKRQCHGCLVLVVDNANYSFLCAMEINVQEKITCKRQKTASCPTNIFPKLLYKTLQTPKVNFEKLLG